MGILLLLSSHYRSTCTKYNQEWERGYYYLDNLSTASSKLMCSNSIIVLIIAWMSTREDRKRVTIFSIVVSTVLTSGSKTSCAYVNRSKKKATCHCEWLRWSAWLVTDLALADAVHTRVLITGRKPTRPLHVTCPGRPTQSAVRWFCYSTISMVHSFSNADSEGKGVGWGLVYKK